MKKGPPIDDDLSWNLNVASLLREPLVEDTALLVGSFETEDEGIKRPAYIGELGSSEASSADDAHFHDTIYGNTYCECQYRLLGPGSLHEV